MGTTVSQMPAGPSRFVSIMGSAQGPENGISVIRQGPYSDAHSSGEWGPQQQDHSEMGSENQYHPNGRLEGLQYGSQSATGQEIGTAYDRADQVTAAEAAHRQEQRGVSSLSHVASAMATNGGSNQTSMAHASPSGGSVSNLGPGMAGISNAGSVLSGGSQIGMEKRGPVEFNHAIGYVNKIKVNSHHPPVFRYKSTHQLRIGFHHNLRSISRSLRFCRLISENQSRLVMSTRKLLNYSVRLPIFLKISSSSCRNQQRMPKRNNRQRLVRLLKKLPCSAMFGEKLGTRPASHHIKLILRNLR